MIDILVSSSTDGKIIFTAQNERAEQWMGEPQTKMSVALAVDYQAAATAAGFKIREATALPE